MKGCVFFFIENGEDETVCLVGIFAKVLLKIRNSILCGKFFSRLCKFLSVKSIIHEKGPSMVYKQKVEFPLPIFGFATN